MTVPERSSPAARLLFEHRPALMSDEQVVHVVRVLFLLRQNPFEQDARRHILIAENDAPYPGTSRWQRVRPPDFL